MFFKKLTVIAITYVTSLSISYAGTIKSIYGNFEDQVWIEKNPEKYYVMNLLDKNKNTCYSFAPNKTKRTSEYIHGITFKTNDFKFDEVIIYNGYHKSDELYKKNSRVKKIEFDFSLKVKDAKMHDGIRYEDVLTKTYILDKSSRTSKIKMNISKFNFFQILVSSYYKGTKYNDVCISEIEFYYKGKKIPINNRAEIKRNYIKQLRKYYKRKVLWTEKKPLTTSYWYYPKGKKRQISLSFLEKGVYTLYLVELTDERNIKKTKTLAKGKWYFKNARIYFTHNNKHYRLKYNKKSTATSYAGYLNIESGPLKGNYYLSMVP